MGFLPSDQSWGSPASEAEHGGSF
ncbi:uncharacterized protein G2W53_031902 [Senna tora]|uniref:Uncharacterized protein n=1 Tax=Senna tora TaxID=362788 RepID=A0A834SW45_9FABA|nr:uncharacterized protein G2W53_031902 [Senna tora]